MLWNLISIVEITEDIRRIYEKRARLVLNIIGTAMREFSPQSFHVRSRAGRRWMMNFGSTFFIHSQIVKTTLRSAARGYVTEIQFALGLFRAGVRFLLKCPVLHALQRFPGSPTFDGALVPALRVRTIGDLLGVLVVVRGTLRGSRSVI
jgi:hypothetical protein